MSPEKEQILRNDFPWIFGEDCLRIDGYITCGDGWYDLLYILCCGLEDELSDIPQPTEVSFTASQIKEKFGLLEFYADSNLNEFDQYKDISDRMRNLIQHAKKESGTTCMKCGANGRLRREGYWHHVYCDRCEGEYQKALNNRE